MSRSGREEHRVVSKGLELERIARRILKEHRRLLAGLADKADVRRDAEFYTGSGNPVGERLPVFHRQHDAEMRHRHVMSVDRVRDRKRLGRRIEMRDDLVAEQVEIDPVIGAAPLRATEHATVKGARGGEIVDREGEMEWAKCHGLMIPHATPFVTPGLSRDPTCRERSGVSMCGTLAPGTSPG